MKAIDYNRHRLWLDSLGLVALIVMASGFLARSALDIFDFFDMAAFMDAGYRVYSGQELYLDFFYLAGPVHPYMHAFFFYLFGFNKTAILVHLVVVNAIVVVATFILARRHLPLLDSLFMALLSVICFYGPTAHPWYDEDAWMWLIVGILVVEIGGTLEGIRAFSLSAFLCGLLVSLSFLTKANIGLVGGAVFFVYFLVQQRPARLITFYCAGGLVGLAGIIGLLESPSDFIFQNFLAFDWKTRLGYVDRFWFVLTYLPYTLFLATLSVMACLGGKAYIKQNLSQLVILAGLLVASIFAAFSGSRLPESSISLVGIQMTYLFILARNLPNAVEFPAEVRIYKTFRVLLVVLALYWTFYSVKTASGRYTWRWKASNSVNDYVLQTEFLKGWRCNRQIGEGVDRAVEYINQNVPEQDSLFAFPDVNIVYGLTGRESFHKAPFIFTLGEIPPPGRLYAEFRKHFLDSPPQWILLHHQTEVDFYDTRRLLQWLRLDGFISRSYEGVWSWEDFVLLHHRGNE